MAVEINDNGFDAIIEEELRTPYRHRTVSMHRNQARRMSRSNCADSQNWIHTAATLTRVPVTDHVEHIVDKIEEWEGLLDEDQIQAEIFREDALRNMPQSLVMRKLIKEKLHMRYKSTRRISLMKRMNYCCTTTYKKCKSHLRDFSYAFELWYPTMKHIEGEFGTATAVYFKFFRFLFLLNLITFLLCFGFIVMPQLLANVEISPQIIEQQFSIADIFTGEGYLENTILFYGGYSNLTLSAVSYFPYSMPRGYFYTMVFVYLLTLGTLAISMAKSYRVHYIQTKGGLKNVFAHKVFCNWDFGIATENAAKLKSSGIYHEFKELIDEEMKPSRRTSFREKIVICTLRVSGTLGITTALGGIGYALWRLLEFHWNEEQGSGITAIFTALIINFVIYVLPIFLPWVIRYEDFKNPRKAFNVTLIWAYAINAVVISVLGAFWLFQANKVKYCWETKLGQEMYRILIFDCIFMVGFFLIEKIILFVVARSKGKELERPEFEIASRTLQLIYNQSIFWLGLLFGPLLSAVVVVKYLISWYFISGVVIKFSRPLSNFWRATYTQTWYLVLTFITLLMALTILGSLIATVKTTACGPFSHLDYAYSFLKGEILKLEKGFHVWRILVYLLKPGVVTLLIITMIAIIYYLHAKAVAQENVVNILREMVTIETKDREFLLGQIHKIAKGWKFRTCATDPLNTPPRKYYIQEQESSAPHEVSVSNSHSPSIVLSQSKKLN